MVGSHATVIEVSADVIRKRRMATVKNLSRRLAGAQTIKDLWSRIIRGIEDADKDMPLCLIYSIDDPSIGSRASSKSSVRSTTKTRTSSEEKPLLACILEGSTGIPPGHPVAATSLGSDNEENWLVPLIKEATRERTPVVAPVRDNVTKMLDGLEWRGFGVPSVRISQLPSSILQIFALTDSLLTTPDPSCRLSHHPNRYGQSACFPSCLPQSSKTIR